MSQKTTIVPSKTRRNAEQGTSEEISATRNNKGKQKIRNGKKN